MPLRPAATTRTHTAFGLANDLARQLGHEEVTPPHVVIGLMREGSNLAAGILIHVWKIPVEVLERDLMDILPAAGSPRSDLPPAWTAADEQMLEQATAESSRLGLEYVAGEHLLLAFLREPTGATARVLAGHGVRYHDVLTDLLTWYGGTIPAPRKRTETRGPSG
jgi:ATP-dependent Clp protease ATP-binding subunit ClpC